MHENYLLFNQVPPGHPGQSSTVGPRESAESDAFRRAAAEAELLRARLCCAQRQCGCEGGLASEAA